MAITAGSILDTVSQVLLDESNVRWPAANLLTYLNEAQRQLVTLSQDAGTVLVIAKLDSTTGTIQTLPATHRAILDMPRNLTYIAPPVASFTAVPDNGDAPLAVQFTDTSTPGGGITGWAWDFTNNGSTDSTAQHPAHTYDTAGTFTAKLTVTGPGGSSSATDVITVTEPPVPPVAAFYFFPDGATAPYAVNFVDESTGSITSVSWDFDDDGIEDSNETPYVFFWYMAPGIYPVTLTVTGPGGSDSVTHNVTIIDGGGT